MAMWKVTVSHLFHSESERVLATQLCLTLCDPMDCSPPGSSVHGILQARLLESVSHSLLQEIFLTQRLNLVLLHLSRLKYRECGPI